MSLTARHSSPMYKAGRHQDASCRWPSSSRRSTSAGATSPSSSSAAPPGPPSSFSSVGCESLPFLETFDPVHPSWNVKTGTFVENSGTWQATDASRRNLATWSDCAYDNASDQKIVRGRVALIQSVSQANAGLVLNYRLADPLTNPHIEYFMLLLNRKTTRVELKRFNGATTITEHTVTPGLPFAFNDWFEIEVDIQPSTTFDVVVKNLTNPAWPQVSFSIATTKYGDNDGKHGVVADRAQAFFDFWELENA